MDCEKEVIQEIGGFHVTKYYANTLYTNGVKENGSPYYGDIYLTKEEVLINHPDAEIREGFGLVDKKTGYHLEDSPDWFDSLEELKTYLEENYKWVVWNKNKGYLSKNEKSGQYYSQNINEETYLFDREDQAYLLCDTYEKPVLIQNKEPIPPTE